jgi:hypothetical protein
MVKDFSSHNLRKTSWIISSAASYPTNLLAKEINAGAYFSYNLRN